MADTRTRIINLPEATTLDSSINFIEDSANGSGTRRVTYDTLKGAINQNLAPEYSSMATYAVGDLCTYKGTLYSCSTVISTAEDWTAAHWTEVNVSAKIGELKSDLKTIGYILNDVYDWEIGGIYSTDGSDNPYFPNRLRSTYYTVTSGDAINIEIKDDSVNSIYIFEYSDTAMIRYQSYQLSGTNNKLHKIANNTTRIRILLVNSGESVIKFDLLDHVNFFLMSSIRSYIKGIYAYGTPDISGGVTSIASFKNNTIYSVTATNMASMTDAPATNTGATILTLSPYFANVSATTQICYMWDGNIYMRSYVGSAYRAWAYIEQSIKYTDITVKMSGGTYTSLTDAIVYTMQNPPTYYDRYRIYIDAGTWDISDSVALVSGGTIDQRGLFVMPYTEIYGAGKNETKITLYYTGTDDDIMTLVSGLNAPYDCTIKDLTVSVKNVRYAIHSDNALSTEASTVSNTKLANTVITLENVHLEHLGFDSGLSPSYKVPSAWGGGSWDNSTRKFFNVEFYSVNVCAFLNHDRTTVTKSSSFEFVGCTFTNINTGMIVSTAYAGAAFISWGSGVTSQVVLIGCKTNKFVALTVVTNQGNANAVCNYNLIADNDIFVAESNTNDSQLSNNYITNDCVVRYASESVVAYTPTTFYAVGRCYATGGTDIGIVLNSANANDEVVIQKSGYIYAPLLNISGLTAKAKYNYVNGEWEETTDDHCLLKMVYGTEIGIINA